MCYAGDGWSHARWRTGPGTHRNGIARATFTRRYDLYTGETKASLGTPTTPPTPRTAAIHEDNEGLIWLFIHVPASTWREGWPAHGTRVGGGVEYAMRAMGYDRMFRTYVEVLDPAQARVITSHMIDGYAFDTLPDLRVALYKVDENGFPRVQIAELTLIRGR